MSQEPATAPVPGLSRRAILRAVGAGGATMAGVSRVAANDGPDGNPFAGFGGTACDVPRTSDTYLPFDTAGDYGGWGGHDYHGTRPGTERNPVVFVHGNTHDACDFSLHAEEYLNRGYLGDELWSITFAQSSPVHAEMARQLDAFVAHIRKETGAITVDIVSHSLGVTGARFWLLDLQPYLTGDLWGSVNLAPGHPAAEPHFDIVDTFVGCAGANHGTYTCGPCRKGSGAAQPCNVISPLCADEPGDPLYDINHYCPDSVGEACPVNETPDAVDYYTIRGGLDYFYADKSSPKLAGANANVLLPSRAHNATRASEPAVELIYQWVGAAGGERERRVPVEAAGTRTDAGDAFTARQTNRVTLSVKTGKPTFLRDLVPYQWDIVDAPAEAEEDDVAAIAVRPHQGVKEVYLSAAPDEGMAPATDHEATYFVEAPASSGTYEFGPAQVRVPEATVWEDVADTTDTNAVVGVDKRIIWR